MNCKVVATTARNPDSFFSDWREAPINQSVPNVLAEHEWQGLYEYNIEAGTRNYMGIRMLLGDSIKYILSSKRPETAVLHVQPEKLDKVADYLLGKCTWNEMKAVVLKDDSTAYIFEDHLYTFNALSSAVTYRIQARSDDGSGVTIVRNYVSIIDGEPVVIRDVGFVVKEDFIGVMHGTGITQSAVDRTESDYLRYRDGRNIEEFRELKKLSQG